MTPYEEWLQNLLRMPQGVLAPQPEPQGLNLPTPNIELEGNKYPRANMGLSLPTYSGDLSMEGSYQRNPNAMPDWALKFGYKRQF